jgi:hypothetical protein
MAGNVAEWAEDPVFRIVFDPLGRPQYVHHDPRTDRYPRAFAYGGSCARGLVDCKVEVYESDVKRREDVGFRLFERWPQ